MDKKLKKLKAILLLLCVSLIGTVFTVSNSRVNAIIQQTAVVYVDPPSVRNLSPSQSFTIAVKIANVSLLYGFDIQFSWNPAILEYVSHTVKVPKNTYPDGVLYNPILSIKNEVNSTAGTYWVAYASIYPAPTFNGTGTIFEMTFHVKSTGRSVLAISACDLSDINGVPIPRDIRNGYFSNYSPTPVDIMVSPRSIVDSTKTPCQSFNINITVINVVDLYNFEVWLDYNTTMLDTSSVQVNPAFPPTQTLVEILESEGKLNVKGWLTQPANSLSGNVVLAVIEFHITSTGETPLDLHNVALKDSFGEAIPTKEPLDGYFNNLLITRMLVYPPELIDPTMKIGDIFNINIKIENAIDMYDFEFKLGYDTNVLTCLGAYIVPPTNDTHFTVEMQINDTAGMIWVYVQYYPPAEPFSIYEAKTVTTIIFQVQNYGQTVLDLYDTRISNVRAEPMTHVAEDGFFATLLRDVAIVSVKVTSSNKVYPGRIVSIEVIAMNRGNMTTETFNVTVYYDNNIIGTQTVIVPPWSNVTLTFYWNTSGLTPCSNFTISARASEVPYELNPANNFMSDGWVKIKMLGDINGDGVIDIHDVVMVTSIYHHNENYPDWNPDADLVPPWGYIDIYDVVTIAAKYGKHCP